ncbi:hypothetical protein [Rhodococcus cercidiphylli]|jgi:hypothetical protein|uniref:Uncharacterized protein n=1 Tax=Rhodococcus cercidiphylli TaxID=489916 RepID=A0ABU4AXA9_9NOCA|nr:hypothetical protein [Rhodococcus cercidiphylli]MDV6230865.1 hypothetical protein [Rhodococcus cercidiphylli]
MNWKITSPTDSDRWLTHTGDTWEADPETTAYLTQPGYAFPLTPTGPVVTITDESTLMAAARKLIPGAETFGDLPPYPAFPSVPDCVY